MDDKGGSQDLWRQQQGTAAPEAVQYLSPTPPPQPVRQMEGQENDAELLGEVSPLLTAAPASTCRELHATSRRMT